MISITVYDCVRFMYLAVIYFTVVGFFIFIIKMSNNSERTIYKTTSMFKKFHDHLP